VKKKRKVEWTVIYGAAYRKLPGWIQIAGGGEEGGLNWGCTLFSC